MNRSVLLPAFILLTCTLQAQIKFRNANNLITPVPHFSGVAIAVADMDGDGLDDLIRLNNGLELSIDYQTAPNKPFQKVNIPAILGEEPQWALAVADVDNNGFCDILTAGFDDGIKYFRFFGRDSFQLSVLQAPTTFTQASNFVDINNDRWLDAFVCHDDALSRIFMNDQTGKLTYDSTVIDMRTVPVSDNSGNYGSVWSDIDNDGDLDLYIAKCRQGVLEENDPRRINQLFINENGTYVQDVTNEYGLRIGAQSWTADFGDIDNDGDFDCFITNHDVTSQLLENDGSGHFTDITQTAGLFDAVTGLPIQGVFRDFDNDGFVDILVSGPIEHLFRNNGDKTFTRVEEPFGFRQMESYAIGDLNKDGFLDVYGGYAKIFNDISTVPDVLWLNEGNGNNYIGFTLHGLKSNRSGIGARLTIHTPNGIQTREVRAGESYGITNTHTQHFGLGKLTTVDSLVVRWPSGIVDVIKQPVANQYYTLFEDSCFVAPVPVLADGPLRFCPGDSVVLSAPAGLGDIVWSNGAAGPSQTIKNTGIFSYKANSPQGCRINSATILVENDPDETPEILAKGPTRFCEGGEVILRSSLEGVAYAWSTGEKTPEITVKSSGIYSLTLQGICRSFNSQPLSVEVLPAPTPVTKGDTTWINGSATLTAQGVNINWYDSPTGGVPLFSGNQFVTPALASTQTYWVDETREYDVPNQFAGPAAHSGTAIGDPNVKGAIIFSAFQPFRIAKFRMYTAKPGVRGIMLLKDDLSIIQYKEVNVPNGSANTTVNIDVPVGENMQLTTDPDLNFQNYGSQGPQLRRSDEDINYPYELPGVLSITGSNIDLPRYYYFYNWEIDFPPTLCTSVRVPVEATVDPTKLGTTHISDQGAIVIYPNPARGQFFVENKTLSSDQIRLRIMDQQGRVLRDDERSNFGPGTRWSLDASDLSSGIYRLEISTETQVVSTKIIIN